MEDGTFATSVAGGDFEEGDVKDGVQLEFLLVGVFISHLDGMTLFMSANNFARFFFLFSLLSYLVAIRLGCLISSSLLSCLALLWAWGSNNFKIIIFRIIIISGSE